MEYESILNVMMWIVASGIALVVGSSMVLLYNSLRSSDRDTNVLSHHSEYDEFYDASDIFSFEKIRKNYT